MEKIKSEQIQLDILGQTPEEDLARISKKEVVPDTMVSGNKAMDILDL